MEYKKNDLLEDLEFLISDDETVDAEQEEEEAFPYDVCDQDSDLDDPVPYYSETWDDGWDRDIYASPDNSDSDSSEEKTSVEVFLKDNVLSDSEKSTLELLTEDPEIIEMRVSEYHHTGVRCLLATMSLGISLDAPVLSQFAKWENRIRERMEHYFQHTFSPHLMDEELFLPSKFVPFEAADAAADIIHGKVSEKEIGKYLTGHEGPVVIEIDSIYENFRANSWMVKFWMVDLKNYKLFYGGK